MRKKDARFINRPLRTNDDGEVEQRCKTCHEWWPLNLEFYAREPKSQHQYSATCKACRSESRRGATSILVAPRNPPRKTGVPTRGPGAVRRTECRFEGCTNPPYEYPGGTRSGYCQEHIRYRKGRRRGDQDPMTGPMQDVLKQLREAKQSDQPHVVLAYPEVDNRTLTYLFDHEWIFPADRDGVIHYTITARGLRALALVEQPANRRDGICPRCNQRPRHVRSSGQKDAYCIDCLRLRGTERRERGDIDGDINRPCSRCKKRPRHQYAGGHYSTYCAHCDRVRNRRRMKRERRKLIANIRAGMPVPLCKVCKKHPRRVYENSVASYCSECLPILARRSKLQRRLNRLNSQPVRRIKRSRKPSNAYTGKGAQP